MSKTVSPKRERETNEHSPNHRLRHVDDRRTQSSLLPEVSIRPCTIQDTLYDTGWGFPAFVPGETGTVKAELIELPVADWPDIDRLEGYPRLYDRRQVPATLAGGDTVEAWVYIMNELPRQTTVLPGGNWKDSEDTSGSRRRF